MLIDIDRPTSPPKDQLFLLREFLRQVLVIEAQVLVAGQGHDLLPHGGRESMRWER